MATTAIAVVDEVKGTLVKMKDNFAASLPKHIDADRFVAVAQTAIINNPHLLQLDKGSLYQSFMKAAQDGLMPDGREAAIVPFAGKATYMPMTGGILKKARNSGEIATIDAQSVYANDQYDSWTDEKGPHFKHVKARGDRGDYILTYAYAIAKDGAIFFEEVDSEDMAAIKKQALSKLPPEKQKNSPWNGPFEDEMFRKSALRRLGKYRLPNSSDLNQLFERNDEDFTDHDVAETPSDAPKTTPTRLSAIIEAQATPTTEEAVAMVKEAIPEAKVVSPATRKPSPAASKPSKLTIKGKIEDLKVKDGEGAKGPWRRFACKVGGQFFGTFDKKIGEQMETALDAGQEITIEYTERKQDGKLYRDIVSVQVPREAGDDDEGEAIPEEQVPI